MARMIDERETWQPIATAPMEGEIVDLWVVDRSLDGEPGQDHHRVPECIWDNGHWWRYATDIQVDAPDVAITHWRFLPSPPTGMGYPDGFEGGSVDYFRQIYGEGGEQLQ